MKTKQEIKNCIIELQSKDDYYKYSIAINYLKWVIGYDENKFDRARYDLGSKLISVITKENYYLDTYNFNTIEPQNWATFRLSGEWNSTKDYAIIWNTDFSNLKVIKGDEDKEQIQIAITKKQEKQIFNIIKRILGIFQKRRELNL